MVLLQGTFTAMQFMLPLVASKKYAAADWQVTLITAAPLILPAVSIFWYPLQARLGVARFMAVYWLVAAAPLIFMGFCDNYWPFAILWIVCSIGVAAFASIAGQTLGRFYPPHKHGLVFGIVTVAWMGGGALASWQIGAWLQSDPQAIRTVLPLAALAQAAGALMLGLLNRGRPGPAPAAMRTSLRAMLEPILHTGQVLRADKLFARYEAAFMTYGIGWMICYALVPLIITDKLVLSYQEAPSYSHVIFLLCNVAATLPAGLLIDRIGAARLCMFSFGLYALYPLGLIFVTHKTELAAASVIYGLAGAGVNAGWMLGPVSLAPTPDKVPQYLAIHTTMVGLRGAVFQALGLLLYKLLDSFTWPLILAAAGFVWAAWQMGALHGLIRSRLAPRSKS